MSLWRICKEEYQQVVLFLFIYLFIMDCSALTVCILIFCNCKKGKLSEHKLDLYKLQGQSNVLTRGL